MSGRVPQGWGTSPLGSIADIVRGVTFPASAKVEPGADGAAACLRTSNVQASIECDDLMFIPRQFVKRADQWLRAGDVVMSMANSANLVGKVAYAESLPRELTFGAFLSVLRAKDVDPAFLFQWLRSPATQDLLRSSASQTVNIANLSVGRIVDLEVPVPPLKEQRRIVAKLAALQSRSRRAREALDAVPPLLEKLRQSILAAAFRGDLTKNWRAKTPNVEPASELHKRIRAERRKQWEEAELAKFKAKGKTPTNDNWKAKYEEPKPVDTTGLPTLPKGWCWVSLDECAARVTDGTHQSPSFTEDGIPFLVIANIIRGSIDWGSVGKWVSQQTYEENTLRCVPERGDVLYTAVGSYGVAVPVETNTRFMFQRHIAHIKPIASVIDPSVLAMLLNAPQTKGRADLVARGVAQKTVTLGELSRFPIPVPPRLEQAELRRRVEALVEKLQVLAVRSDNLRQRLDDLERSVLAAAFRGELVTQDPTDEPADVMLARLHGRNATPGDAGPKQTGPKRAKAEPRRRA